MPATPPASAELQAEKQLAGLSEAEAAARLSNHGFNELPTAKARSIIQIALEVVREPMFIMLLAAGGLYLILGEPVDALMLLGFVFVVMAITITQERRTERALDALRDLSSPRALVIRDGIHRRIPGRDVVSGAGSRRDARQPGQRRSAHHGAGPSQPGASRHLPGVGGHHPAGPRTYQRRNPEPTPVARR